MSRTCFTTLVSRIYIIDSEISIANYNPPNTVHVYPCFHNVYIFKLYVVDTLQHRIINGMGWDMFDNKMTYCMFYTNYILCHIICILNYSMGTTVPIYMYIEILITNCGGGICMYNMRGVVIIILYLHRDLKTICDSNEHNLILINYFKAIHKEYNIQVNLLIIDILDISMSNIIMEYILIGILLKVKVFAIISLFGIILHVVMHCILRLNVIVLCSRLCSVRELIIDISMFTYEQFLRHVTGWLLYSNKGNAQGGGDYYYVHQWVYLTYRDFG